LRRTKFDQTPHRDRDENMGARRVPAEKPPALELRHQRTGDVVFDWTNPANPFSKPTYYTYKLIETLLPKAMNKLPAKQCTPGQFDEARRIKMIELWAGDSEPRKGWLKLVSLR